MAPHTREWSVPAPVRALLWWPGVSFVLVIVSPDTVEATLVASGALLAVTGGFVSMAGAHLRAHRVAMAGAPTTVLGSPVPAAPSASGSTAPDPPPPTAAPPATAPSDAAPSDVGTDAESSGPDTDPPTTELPTITAPAGAHTAA